MAAGVPPPPLNSPSGSFYWLQWYSTLTDFLNGTNIPWANLNFTGSNITDIITRHHNDLQQIQGGDGTGSGQRWHLKGSLFIGFVSGAGSAISLPAGWTVTGTNPYTVTHSLGLAANTYVVTASAQSASSTVNRVDYNTNTFVLTLSAATNWSFILTQGS